MADRTAIDALKAAARAKREARGPEGEEAAPHVDESIHASATVVDGPLAQLGHAEALRDAMRHSIVACNVALSSFTGAAEAASELQALVVSLSGNVGKLVRCRSALSLFVLTNFFSKLPSTRSA
jgi:hypothetical protein